MRHLTIDRKWLITGVTLALVLVLGVAGYSSITFPPAHRVEAQSNQPSDTIDLFKPFWETWQLLHQNYVDPLNDNKLTRGAISGLIQAVSDPNFRLTVSSAIPANATTTDERFVPFWNIWNLIHSSVKSPDDTALMEGALRGMMASIGDPHTDYMDPKTFAMVNASMSGEYEGIGATVRQNKTTGGLELVSIFKGSPADKAGLEAGDQIVRVDDKDVTSLSQDQIIALVRGPAGTSVQLGILRTGKTDILKFEVTREKITVPSVESKMLDGDIGYIILSQFEINSAPELRAALQKLDANHLKGLILDVRGDPGGYLTTVIDIASAFIPEGTVVIERSPGNETDHPALGNAIAPDVPMVILVDQGSASASELLAGALQDHQRAKVVGMETFGKGSVQTWFELSNKGGIRITISRWYTPDNHSVTDVGIHPDVVVPYVPQEKSGVEDNQLDAAVKVLQGTYQPTQAEKDALQAMAQAAASQ